MKLYGYQEGNGGERQLLTLNEVTLMAGSIELRAIADALLDIANEMDSPHFDHVHLSDRILHLSESPELVVMKEGC